MARSKEDGFHLNGWRTDRRNGEISRIYLNPLQLRSAMVMKKYLQN